MSKYHFILAAAVLISGCSPETQSGPDQCLRREIFQQCMQSLPAGPQQTRYNDWAEVVAQCNTVSYYQSHRRLAEIAPACRF